MTSSARGSIDCGTVSPSALGGLWIAGALAAFFVGSVLLSSAAEARCWWNGYNHCRTTTTTVGSTMIGITGIGIVEAGESFACGARERRRARARRRKFTIGMASGDYDHAHRDSRGQASTERQPIVQTLISGGLAVRLSLPSASNRDFEPFGAWVVGLVETLGEDALKVVLAHEIERNTASAFDGKRLHDERRSLRDNAVQASQTLAKRQGAKVGAIPEKVEGHVGRPPRAPDEVVEVGAAGLVGRNYLAVKNGVVHLELGRRVVAKHIEALQEIAVERDEPRAALLDVAEASITVVLEFEEPFGIVEWCLAGNRDDELYSRKWHP
jgi:hypothetical protein